MWIKTLDVYADDSTLSVSFKSVKDLEHKLSSDMRAVDDWCNKNRMATKSTKTKAMLMTAHQKT